MKIKKFAAFRERAMPVLLLGFIVFLPLFVIVNVTK